MTDFEYDRTKSEVNRDKHGIDFEQGKSLWDDPLLLVVPARTDDELRFLAVGKIEGSIGRPFGPGGVQKFD